MIVVCEYPRIVLIDDHIDQYTIEFDSYFQTNVNKVCKNGVEQIRGSTAWDTAIALYALEQ